MAELTPVSDIPTYAVIIRCLHERGLTQIEALRELPRRGSWLTSEMCQQAGIAAVEYRAYELGYWPDTLCGVAVWTSSTRTPVHVKTAYEAVVIHDPDWLKRRAAQ